MTTTAKKGKSSGAGKKSGPGSLARVERKRKGAAGGTVSLPKVKKGEHGDGGTGGRGGKGVRNGGGLH